ncbi:outer membrane protein [Kushneria sinocarnis]|uniref:Outer membrane protein n=1 Tax=Kushneria sinocarnis TaxID=595502 RepID=A0A420WTA5_9GAMM|nr:OmpW family outer membrane protein [Kushneria sinocarnis]RKQ96322.1 outer membrane protein [Kushneria sinocarnis]
MKMSRILTATIVAGSCAFAAQSALAYGQGDVFVRGDVTKSEPTGTGAYDSDHGWTGAIGVMPFDKIGVELNTSNRAKYDGDNGGHFKARPYSLLAQYYPLGGTDATVQPYVGAGATYMRFNGADLNDRSGVDDSNWGWTGQVGVDMQVTDHWAVNGFAQYTDIDVDYSGGGDDKLNPVTVGGGITYRF